MPMVLREFVVLSQVMKLVVLDAFG